MSKPITPPPTDLPQVLRENARFGAMAFKRGWVRIALLFVAVVLPLWGFGGLAEEVHEGEPFFFDTPLLEWARTLHSAGADRLFLFISKIGYGWGVIPADIALIVVLALLRRKREGLFAGVAVAGSALLNLAAKHYFARARPQLWLSLAPENTYSFPSGHAMGSMTLVAVLVLLAWHTRWRWLTVMLGVGFVLMVGLSRVYLGVHYPSDILAGWAAALAWTIGVYALLFRGAYRPWRWQRALPIE